MKFINFQTDRLKNISLLSDAEAGKVLKMMAQYASSGDVPTDVPPVAAILFQAIQEDMEYFDTKYSKRCETNKRIAKERDEARKENERNTNVKRTLNERSLNRKEKIENRKDKYNKDSKNLSLINDSISFSDNAQMNEAISRWVAYKKERGQTYKPIGLKAFITKLDNLSGGKGDAALKIVEQSMANNYSGVFPLKNNQEGTNKPDVGVVLQDSNNKDYSKGGW